MNAGLVAFASICIALTLTEGGFGQFSLTVQTRDKKYLSEGQVSEKVNVKPCR